MSPVIHHYIFKSLLLNMLRTHDILSLKMSLYLGLQVLVTVMDIQYLATDKHDHVYMSVHFNILQLTKNEKKKL